MYRVTRKDASGHDTEYKLIEQSFSSESSECGKINHKFSLLIQLNPDLMSKVSQALADTGPASTAAPNAAFFFEEQKTAVSDAVDILKNILKKEAERIFFADEIQSAIQACRWILPIEYSAEWSALSSTTRQLKFLARRRVCLSYVNSLPASERINFGIRSIALLAGHYQRPVSIWRRIVSSSLGELPLELIYSEPEEDVAVSSGTGSSSQRLNLLCEKDFGCYQVMDEETVPVHCDLDQLFNSWAKEWVRERTGSYGPLKLLCGDRLVELDWVSKDKSEIEEKLSAKSTRCRGLSLQVCHNFQTVVPLGQANLVVDSIQECTVHQSVPEYVVNYHSGRQVSKNDKTIVTWAGGAELGFSVFGVGAKLNFSHSRSQETSNQKMEDTSIGQSLKFPIGLEKGSVAANISVYQLRSVAKSRYTAIANLSGHVVIRCKQKVRFEGNNKTAPGAKSKTYARTWAIPIGDVFKDLERYYRQFTSAVGAASASSDRHFDMPKYEVRPNGSVVLAIMGEVSQIDYQHAFLAPITYRYETTPQQEVANQRAALKQSSAANKHLRCLLLPQMQMDIKQDFVPLSMIFASEYFGLLRESQGAQDGGFSAQFSVAQQVLDISQLFNSLGEHRILLMGPPGVGKSSSLEKFVHHWATSMEKEKFEWIFLIPSLSILDEGKYQDLIVSSGKEAIGYTNSDDGVAILLTECFSVLDCKSRTWRILQDKLLRAVQQGKVAILFDGFDEVSAKFTANNIQINNSGKKLPWPLPLLPGLRWLFNTPQVLVVSRSGDIGFLREQFGFAATVTADENVSIPHIYEVLGFDDAGVTKYLDRFFAHLEEDLYFQEAPHRLKGLKQLLESYPQVKDLCMVPINAEVIATTAYKRSDFDLSSLLNIIYDNVLAAVCRRNIEKTGNTAVRVWPDTVVLEHHDDRIRFLEWFAYLSVALDRSFMTLDTIINGNTLGIGTMRAGLTHELRRQAGKIIVDQLAFGLIRGTSYSDAVGIVPYGFIHSTFRNYFAARFLLSCMKSNQMTGCPELCVDIIPHWNDRRVSIKALVKRHRFSNDFEQIAEFVVGMIVAEKKFVLLEQFFDLLAAKPIDLQGIVTLRIFVKCLEQVSAGKMLTDFYAGIFGKAVFKIVATWLLLRRSPLGEQFDVGDKLWTSAEKLVAEVIEVYGDSFGPSVPSLVTEQGKPSQQAKADLKDAGLLEWQAQPINQLIRQWLTAIDVAGDREKLMSAIVIRVIYSRIVICEDKARPGLSIHKQGCEQKIQLFDGQQWLDFVEAYGSSFELLSGVKLSDCQFTDQGSQLRSVKDQSVVAALTEEAGAGVFAGGGFQMSGLSFHQLDAVDLEAIDFEAMDSVEDINKWVDRIKAQLASVDKSDKKQGRYLKGFLMEAEERLKDLESAVDRHAAWYVFRPW